MDDATWKEIKWKKINGTEHTLKGQDLTCDLLKLEEYLNWMIEQGWRPICVNGGTNYTFVPCLPGEYICRTVLTVTKNGFLDKKAIVELSELLAADGALFVEQRNTLGSQMGLIAVRSATLGVFEIHSDIDSRIAEFKARKKHNEGIATVFIALAFAYIPLGISMDLYAMFGVSVAFAIVAYIYWRPVGRYKEIIARLQAERDVTEV